MLSQTLARAVIATTLAALIGCGGGSSGGGGQSTGGASSGGNAGGSGGGSPGPGDVLEYFPDAVGARWFYTGISTAGGSTVSPFFNERQVTRKLTIRGIDSTAFLETQSVVDSDPRTVFFSKDMDGVWQQGGQPQNALQGSLIPYRFAHFPVEMGEVESKSKSDMSLGLDLDGDGVNERLDASLNVRMTGFESLQVDIGSFPDSARFLTSLSGKIRASGGGSANFSIEETNWFAPGIGLVKRSTETVVESQRFNDTFELRGYDLGGEKRGMQNPWLIAGELAPPNSDESRPGRAAVATDGTDFLVVTRKQIRVDITTPIMKFIGLLVDADGTVSQPFDINVPGVDTNSPDSVAADYGDGVYAVVFVDEDFSRAASWMRLQRIDSDGMILESPGGRQIAGNRAGVPAIAWGSGVFLVVFNRYDRDSRQDHVYGMLIAPDGTIQGDGEFPIATAPGNQMRPRVAFDGMNFLVVWTDTTSGNADYESFDIVGTRVTPTGIVMDPAGIGISRAPGRQERPDVAARSGQFLVAWQDARNYPGRYDRFEIRAARVASDGTVLDGLPDTGGLVLNAYPDTDKHDVTVGFNGDEYVVAWTLFGFRQPSGPFPGIYAARITPSGIVRQAAAPGISVSGMPSDGTTRLAWPVLRSTGGRSLMVWLNVNELASSAPEAYKAIRGTFLYRFPP